MARGQPRATGQPLIRPDTSSHLTSSLGQSVDGMSLGSGASHLVRTCRRVTGTPAIADSDGPLGPCIRGVSGEQVQCAEPDGEEGDICWDVVSSLFEEDERRDRDVDCEGRRGGA